MYHTCILKNQKNGRYYIGSTHDPQLRLVRRNAGWSRSTKGGVWTIVVVEEYATKSLALKREREIKSMKSRKYIERIIHAGGRPDLGTQEVVPISDREVPSAPHLP